MIVLHKLSNFVTNFHQLIILINRCTLDMSTCEEFNSLALTNLCRYINDEKGMAASFFRSIDPVLHCPIKPGIYKFKKSIVDLSFTLPMPMEGYRWKADLKLYSRIRPKKELLCVASQSMLRWTNKP